MMENAVTEDESHGFQNVDDLWIGDVTNLETILRKSQSCRRNSLFGHVHP